MKATQLKDATAVTTVPVPSEVHADTTPDTVYRFPSDQAIAASPLHRHRWERSEHIEDFHMLAKLRSLSDDNKARVKTLVEELHETEIEEKKLREFGKSRRVFNHLWDNPDDAEYNNL